MVLEEFTLRHGSGGEGRFRGGDGTRRKTRFLEPMTLAVLSNHRIVPPPGLEAGSPGQCGIGRVIRGDGSTETLASADKTEVQPGDIYWLETPTGGGFTPA